MPWWGLCNELGLANSGLWTMLALCACVWQGMCVCLANPTSVNCCAFKSIKLLKMTSTNLLICYIILVFV